MSDVDEIYLICVKCGIVHRDFFTDPEDVRIWVLKGEHTASLGCGKENIRLVTVKAHDDLRAQLRTTITSDLCMGYL